ncbi:MAG: metallophosphoesterase [Nitrospirae bacterium]|nr:metallophosphoesterase [Nitrospirota bacterium]MBF0590785.1 metallophosphoesterase [Nitrospirota bacterium]
MLQNGLVKASWNRCLMLVVLLLFVGYSAAPLDCQERKKVDDSSFEEYLKAKTTDTFRFVVYGDSRSLTNSVNENVISKINKEIVSLDPRPLFVIYMGDLAIRGGTDMYDLGKEAMKQLNDAQIPYAMVVGNHDLYKSFPALGGISADMQSEYQRSFCESNTVGPICFPEDPKLPGYKNLAFAFEFGNSFFAILDTYYVTKRERYYDDISQKQLQWFKDKLSNTGKKYKFVFAHKAIYSSGVHKHPPKTHMLALMDVLNNKHVDIYFAAHEHYYVRRKIEQPNEDCHNKADDHKWKNGVTHIVDGGGGALLANPKPKKYNLSACAKMYNFTVIDVTSDNITGVTYGFKKEDIKPIDKFCLQGDGKPCPGWESQDNKVDKCIFR